jgi:hypothetical protein
MWLRPPIPGDRDQAVEDLVGHGFADRQNVIGHLPINTYVVDAST